MLLQLPRSLNTWLASPDAANLFDVVPDRLTDSSGSIALPHGQAHRKSGTSVHKPWLAHSCARLLPHVRAHVFAGSFVTGITGCYYNVMGFPLHRVCAELRDLITTGTGTTITGAPAADDGAREGEAAVTT